MTDVNELLYIPFLKLKQNEIMALKELYSPIKDLVIPFFDYPPDQDDTQPKSFEEEVPKQAIKLAKHFGEGRPLYIDTYNVDDQYCSGTHSYLYLLRELSAMHCIPVTGIDRTLEHKQAIIDYLAESDSPNQTIALRITYEDFSSYYAIEYEIEEALDGLLNDLFTEVDLVMDCRLVHKLNDGQVEEFAQNITDFVTKFTQRYSVRNVIVTGSSVPVMVREICSANNYQAIPRNEMTIHSKVSGYLEEHEKQIYFGDYTVVSPEFAQPNTLSNLLAVSRLLYPNQNDLHIWRGGKLRPRKGIYNGHFYNQHIRDLIGLTPAIYRGASYSFGDDLFFQKRNLTNGFTQSSIVKPLVNIHISYMSQIYSR